ncbi:MAG: YjbQ family protein [Clostridiaceae bacterium]|nr:YjbQ family protein [Clostridiaceae bacterium]
MVFRHNLRTRSEGFYDVTLKVRESVQESGIKDGICVVFCPHTTAAMTINENADPDVVSDLLFALNKTFPKMPEFRHAEGNTTAHLKASCIGSSVMVVVENGNLVLGTWQGIYFCEFDGPRNRSFIVKVLPG